MGNILPFVLIIVSIAAIIFLVVKKYPQLVLLDVDSIPGKKDKKKKAEFLKKRAKKKAEDIREMRWEKLQPVYDKFKELQEKFRKYVAQIKNEIQKQNQQKKQTTVDQIKDEKSKDEVVTSLIKDGDHAVQEEELEEAEKKYLEAIRIDPKNEKAYRKLADVYYKKEEYGEAKETYQFLSQLNPEDDFVLVKLAELAEREDNIEEAASYYQKAVLINDSISTRFVKLYELLRSIEEYGAALEAMQQAVELEPKNPRYLDNLVEIAIINADVELAEDAYQRLRVANPDNEKLSVLKDKIEKKKEELQEESVSSS